MKLTEKEKIRTAKEEAAYWEERRTQLKNHCLVSGQEDVETTGYYACKIDGWTAEAKMLKRL